MPETRLPEVETAETRQALAEALLALFDEWQLHEVNQATLIGMPDVAGLRSGEPLPADREVLECVGHILAIGRALLKAFPYKTKQRHQWINNPHPKLDYATPLQYMLGGGIDTIRDMRELAEHEPHTP